MLTCLLTHSLKVEEARTAHPIFKTTTGAYGSRRPLEMFGPSEHRIVASRSKEPSGNGTKCYNK